MLETGKKMRVLVEGKQETVITRKAVEIDNGTLIVLLDDKSETGWLFEKAAYNKKEAGVTLRDADGKCLFVTTDYVLGVLTD